MPWLRRLGKWALRVVIFGAVAGVFFYLTANFWEEQLGAYALGSLEIKVEKTGRFLPEIDEVEVILLGGIREDLTRVGFDDGSLADYKVIGRATLREGDAQKIAELWRWLPRGQLFSASCHEPLYGLQFRREGKLLFETTICWGCQNYSLPMGPGGIFGNAEYGFDAKSKTSQELLALLKQKVPIPENAPKK